MENNLKDKEFSMSIREELQSIEKIIKDIEQYSNNDIWFPGKQIQVSTEIDAVDKTLNQLVVGHTKKDCFLSEKETEIVENLLKLKRLNNIKYNLPSSPFA